MKKTILLFFGFTFLFISSNASAQVGIGTTTPRGALDISSSTNGFVPPQVALTSVNVAAPIVNPQGGILASGTIVYNTAIAGSSPNNVTPGYYFWDGSVWIKFNTGNTAIDVDDDLRVPLDKGSASASLEYFSGSSGPQIWVFRNNAAVEAMSFTLQLPHNWKDGTTIYPHIHWIPRATATGNIKWNLDYTWANLNTGTFSAITTISGINTGPFTINQHLLADIGTGINGTGMTYSSVLICRIWRDSSATEDTYNADAAGLSMDFHISIKDLFVGN
ncbi:hypothetical protein FLSI110296_00865 [Flavobacterium sinopsychrotolerans]|uniref:Uncharacterized protein n=1 Tax=Flavobacterium sinopsychrotolerans TaxID=604089 RepID=A0A1H8I2A2_9FLAO|nr:hypothetical protein [Flavobacterium sinopsychrotolerans]SEN62870.1 hypothetical protein SAMN04487942_0417 [Flavobacterium sinopsychrotolerans]